MKAILDKPRNHAPIVYFMECGEFVKIGTTQIGLARQRLHTLQVGSPYPIRALGYMPGNQAVEAMIHDAYKSQWERGEWFRMSPELLAYIKRAAIRWAF